MPEYNNWQTIEEDEFYKRFIDKDKTDDIKVSAVLQGLTVADQLKKLAEGISLLDLELQQQVLGNHETLLSQATWVEKLEGVLSVMHTHIQCLLSAVERLRTKVVEPFGKIETQTVMLSRLHATSHLLRRVARIQHLSKRLDTQMQSGSDITRAALSLSELSLLSEDVDFSGLEVVEADQRSIRAHRSEVERQAKLLLMQGLHSNNQQQVATAIQVFYNLSCLTSVVKQLVEGIEQNVAKSIKEALDIQSLSQGTAPSEPNRTRGGPGRAAMPTPGSASLFRPKLWSTLERLFDTSIYSECSQVELLQRVLSRKIRDPNAFTQHQNLSYLETFPEDMQYVAANHWLAVTTLLACQLAQSSQSSTFVKQALEGEYPKFLRLYLDLCKKLQSIGCSLDQVQTSNKDSFKINREVVTQFENAYLSRSVSRLLDPVNLMFSGDNLPPNEEVDALVRTITSELSVSLVDETLSKTVARNISKTVRLFCIKCEQMVPSGGDTTQVIDSCTASQNMNISLSNLLHYLESQVSRVVSNMNLPSDTATIVLESLTSTQQLTVCILMPLLASMSDAVEAILLTMHAEDYSMCAPADVDITVNMGVKKAENQCSLYMKELEAFILRAVNTYLSPFHNQAMVTKCSLPVAERCVELFLRHACLVRPLGDGGKIKLVADTVQMEVAVAPLCKQVSRIGRSYKMLRSFKPLLFQTVEEVVSNPALGDILPYSLALSLLFSRGPSELPSPHQSANWSLSRLSQWMDTNRTERAVLELMGGALQAYQQSVRQRGETSFHSIYPVMISLLQRGLQHCANK